ncbi:MAG: thioredoxin [Clostridia bacterium]|nr:thioredoxin [Clostridia bacterium]
MSENVMKITAENFDETISKGVTLVDFWAEWCGPCKMLAPVLDSAANELKGKAQIGKVNVDEQGSLAMKFSIMSIPTLIIFKDGQLKERVSGFRQQNAIVAMVKKYL